MFFCHSNHKVQICNNGDYIVSCNILNDIACGSLYQLIYLSLLYRLKDGFCVQNVSFWIIYGYRGVSY